MPLSKRVCCSWRDRHCPRYQGKQTQAWIAKKQQSQLLRCRYFHLVFSLPDELNDLPYSHDETQAQQVYGALLEAA
jgi:hypothetical protein